jgi:hypothetical protein
VSRARLSLAVALALLVGGCRATWEQHVEPPQRAFYRGDADSSARLLTAQLADARRGADEDILRLELAMALQAAGRYAEAARQLVLADRSLEELDYTSTPLDDLAYALFAAPRDHYRAPRPEKLLLNTQNMINYLGAGQWEDAAVEARRARILMLQPDLPADEKYSNRLAWALAGVALSQAGSDGEAADAFREAGDTDLARAPGPGEGSVLVLVQNGKAPVRMEAAYWLWVDGLYHRLQIPALVSRPSGFARASVTVDGKPAGMPTTLLDIGGQAEHRYAEEFPRLIAAAALQAVPRAIVADRLADELEDDDKPDHHARNQIARLFGSLAVEWLASSLPSDTRSWSLLPREVRAMRLNLPAGTHVIEVELEGEALTGKSRRMEWTVEVTPGGLTLVNAITATREGWKAPPDPRTENLSSQPAGIAALALLESVLGPRDHGESQAALSTPPAKKKAAAGKTRKPRKPKSRR